MTHFMPATGTIEVICGCMFSGKSEELIKRLRRAQIAKQRVQIFKPKLDNRYANDQIVSHSDLRLKAILIENSRDLIKKIDDRAEVIGIDEVQFFDENIVDVCRRLANMGRRIIVAGLDMDYRGVPFEPMPQIMAIAEYVTKQLAICMRCGAPAGFTQRLIASSERIVVGAANVYEARCRRCFEPDLSAQMQMELEGTDKSVEQKSATEQKGTVEQKKTDGSGPGTTGHVEIEGGA